MRVEPSQLVSHLGKTLAPVYVIAGDELLLRVEAVDAIREAARNKGFNEREVHEIDKSTDFTSLQSNQTLSLFSTLQIKEYWFNANPNKEAQAFFADLIEQASDDTVSLIVLPELKWKDLDAPWFKALVAAAVFVPTNNVGAEQFAQWLKQRCAQESLHLEPEALELMSHWFEGNLLACSQLLKQLVLLFGSEAISADAVKSVASESARYQLFDVVDIAFAGDAARVLRMWQGLCQEDYYGALRSVSGILARDVQQLVEMRSLIAQGSAPSQAAWEVKVWKARHSAYLAASKRHSLQSMVQWLSQLSALDASVKGVGDLLPELRMERLLLSIAGVDGMAA